MHASCGLGTTRLASIRSCMQVLNFGDLCWFSCRRCELLLPLLISEPEIFLPHAATASHASLLIPPLVVRLVRRLLIVKLDTALELNEARENCAAGQAYASALNSSYYFFLRSRCSDRS